MNLLTAIDAIKQHLLDARLEASIEDVPDNPDQTMLSHPKCAIQVGYRMSTFSDPGASAGPQKADMRWEIYVVTRQLNGNSGVYAYLTAIKSALYGRLIGRAGKLYPVMEQYVSYNNGIWKYVIMFKSIMPYYGQNQ